MIIALIIFSSIAKASDLNFWMKQKKIEDMVIHRELSQQAEVREQACFTQIKMKSVPTACYMRLRSDEIARRSRRYLQAEEQCQETSIAQVADQELVVMMSHLPRTSDCYRRLANRREVLIYQSRTVQADEATVGPDFESGPRHESGPGHEKQKGHRVVRIRNSRNARPWPLWTGLSSSQMGSGPKGESRGGG